MSLFRPIPLFYPMITENLRLSNILGVYRKGTFASSLHKNWSFSLRISSFFVQYIDHRGSLYLEDSCRIWNYLLCVCVCVWQWLIHGRTKAWKFIIECIFTRYNFRLLCHSLFSCTFFCVWTFLIRSTNVILNHLS